LANAAKEFVILAKARIHLITGWIDLDGDAADAGFQLPLE
jgi:hypothetical protein